MVTEIPDHEFVVPCCTDGLDMWESFEYSGLKRVSIVAGERIIIRCNTCSVAYNRLRRRRKRQRTKNGIANPFDMCHTICFLLDGLSFPETLQPFSYFHHDLWLNNS